MVPGGWWDALTMVWKDVTEGACYDRVPLTEGGELSLPESAFERQARWFRGSGIWKEWDYGIGTGS